jgi:peptide/nickel transport system substrate-binding protein
MKRTNKRAVLVAFSGVVALTAAACGGGSTTATSTSSGTAAAGAKGGTLYYVTKRSAEHLDPQRTYIGRDIADEARIMYRTLTTFPVAPGKDSLKIVADMATDTGTATDQGKTWKFTLKDGLKWQDGKDIACADFQYGISRTFAVDTITGGPNYAIQFLDIPSDAKGGSIYKGPYVKDAAGQAAFDKAITCSGKDITFHLKKPVGDFNYATYLPSFAPYRKDQDQGDKSNFAVFSTGPYMLQGAWTKGKGGTFVRNPKWDAKTDTVRKALPDSIVFVEGLTNEVIAQRLISDQGNDKFTVTDRQVPPSFQPQVLANASMKSRFENVDAPFVDYLTPNFKTLKNPLVRQALAVSTDKTGYITANGGATSGRPAQTLISPSVLGYKAFNAFNAPDNGDAAKAATLLKQAAVKTPYPINFTYNGGTPTSEKYAAALKAGWERNGNFKVTLNELTDTYYDVVQNPANAGKYDVTWAGWGADWPSASTVIPPLFDSRVNLSAASNGQDYGYYDNADVNKKIDEAYATTDLTKQFGLWGDLDEQLAKDVAYIPLAYEKFFFIWGSGVKGWIDNPAFADYPDLGSLGVK